MPAVTVMPSISVYVVLHDFKQNNKKKIVSILLQVAFLKKLMSIALSMNYLRGYKLQV